MKKLLVSLVIMAIIFGMVINTTIVFAQDTLKAPIVHLSFEDNYNDLGNKHNGTKSGGVTFTNGVIGKAVEFSGGYIDLANTSSLDFSNGLSLSIWVRLNTDDNKIAWPILYKQGTHEGWPIALFQLSYGGTIFESRPGFGEDYPNYTYEFYSNERNQSAQIIEKWAHMAVVFDGAEEKLYVDGVLSDAQYVPDEILAYSTELAKSSRNLRIGKSEDETFKGAMDEFMLFDYVLSEDEVLALYNKAQGQYNGKIELKIDNPTIYVNGEGKKIDPQNDSIAPVIIDGRTLVPIRAIIDAIGGTIGWDGTERRVDISYKTSTLKLWIDNKNAEVNGQKMGLDVPPMTISERTMLPIRFVSENLGMKVEWDQNTQTIILRYIK